MGDMTNCANCDAPAYRFSLCQRCKKDPMIKEDPYDAL